MSLQQEINTPPGEFRSSTNLGWEKRGSEEVAVGMGSNVRKNLAIVHLLLDLSVSFTFAAPVSVRSELPGMP